MSMHLPSDTVGEGIVFSRCSSSSFVRSFFRSFFRAVLVTTISHEWVEQSG